MIISCNECDSSFAVDDNLVKETGSKVRCSKCNSIFVAYPQPLDTDDGDDLGLDDLDASMAALEDDGEPLGLTDGLADELELDLEDFDDALVDEDEMEAAGLSADSDGELELDLDLNDEDDSDLDMSEDGVGSDELPDLGDFEDLAGLDDDSLALDDTDEGLEDFDLDLEGDTESDELELELEGDTESDELDLELEGATESDELDLELEGATESDELDLELEGDQELDLADLDEAEDTADSDDLDLGLDLDLDDDIPADELSDDLDLDLEEELDGEEVAEAGAAIEEADELDLSDLDLEMTSTSASDDTADAVADDLDLDLDLEEETSGGEEVAETGVEFEEADELDLSNLGLEMEDASVSDGTSDAEPDDIDLGLDLEEETPSGGEITEAGTEMNDTDELDLSDLEEIIDSEESPATADAAEDLELDFDLDGDPDSPTDAAGAAAEGDSELDFSDLEQMLETDDAPAADDLGDELDLEFDIDEQPASEGTDASAAADISDGAGEDDFLDIEKMLEGGDEATPDLESADDDLSLTMEAALDDAAHGADDDLDLDFDIESELQDDDALESNLLDSDDPEFLDDTGIEDYSGPDSATTDEFSSTEGDFGATDVLPIDEEGVPGVPETASAVAKPKKSRSKKPVLVAVLLLLLAFGVIVLPQSLGIKIPYISDIKIPYLSDIDLNIPYLSDWLNPEEQDVAGNLRINPLGRTISGRFVNTASSGRLFVIRGKIKNEYDHPRSFVKVTGKLYQGKKKLVQKSTVYIGNVIPESELAEMDIAAINKRMKNKFGNKRSNLKIKAGKMVPFMIVFDKLPNNLDEYTVEVASSSI
jgi:predicted Zn finger-like uncharacterized protein